MPAPQINSRSASETTREQAARKTAFWGILAALAAFLIWGASVVFFKALQRVPAPEIIAHRVIWSVLWTGLYLAWRGRLSEVRAALQDRRTALTLTLTSILISLNWGVFVWAVTHGRVVEAALGYFMLPLISVAIGFVLLRERLNGAQTLAVLLALIAVLAQSFAIGTIPWVALSLALLFAFYGFARKTLPIGSSPGLMVEVLVLGVPALGYLVYLELEGVGHFAHSGSWITGLLLATGPLTAIPLILYAESVKRLRMVTVGLIFYVNPIVQFLIGAMIYGEPVSEFKLGTFALIWAALAIFAWDALRTERARHHTKMPTA